MPGKKVVILGSGDIGLIMARRMTLEGAEVKMVCELLPFSGGLTRNIVQCLDDFNIPLKLSTTVVEVHGNDRVTGITIAKVDEHRNPIPETFEYVECDTLLLSVGLIPENELSKQIGIDMDPVTKGPVVTEMRQTTQKGVFACGNVLQVHDLVDYVTKESQIAGRGAAEFIKKDGKDDGVYIATKGINGVRYIVPQRINIKSEDDVILYFRVADVYKNKKIVVSAGSNVILERKKAKLAPGEMENITLKKDMLAKLNSNDEIVVSIEEA